MSASEVEFFHTHWLCHVHKTHHMKDAEGLIQVLLKKKEVNAHHRKILLNKMQPIHEKGKTMTSVCPLME